jgi:hypothetical protein
MRMSTVSAATAAVVSLGALAAAGTASSSPALRATGRQVGPVQIVRPGSALATNQSSNWSGYNQGSVEQGGKLFTSISARWVVPTVSQHTAGQAEDSATWIGIGGGCVTKNCDVTDSTLIQTGTEQDVAANGATSYDAWFELIPAPELIVTNVAIHPGDTIAASITRTLPEVWKITLRDVTDGQGFSKTLPYSSTMDTAEWIEETPLVLGTGAGLAALPSFAAPVRFDLATVDGSPAHLKAAEEMQLVSSSGTPLITPSGPDTDADGFDDCAWASSCSTFTS